MKRLFVYCKDNFKFLLQYLPESTGLSYYFFSEITQLNIAIQQLKPDAILFDSIEFDNAISSGIDGVGNKTPIIISGTFTSLPKIPNSQIHCLPDIFNKADVFKLFSKLKLINNSFIPFADIPKHKNHSEEIKNDKQLENQQFLNLLMDNIPDAIYFKDRASRFTKINHAQAVTLGVNTPEDAIGKRDEDFLGGNQGKETYKDEQNLMNSGIPLINKLEHIVTSSVDKYVRATKIPLKDAKGHSIGMVGISRDVSNEYKIGNELRKEKKFMDLLMDNLPDRIYFKDRDSRFIRCNMALAKMFGLNSPEEMYGKTDFDFFESVHAKEAFEDEQRIMKKRSVIIDKLESHIKNGERFWELTTKIPFVNSKNEVIGLVGISHNFTKQKKLEDNLEKEKELLQILMDNVPDYIYFKDKNSKFIRANKAVASFLKTDVNEMIGKTDLDYLSKETAEEIYKQDSSVFKNDVEIINQVEKLENLDGKTIWVSTTKIPISDEHSKVIGLVGVSRDVTILELTKQQFEMAKVKAEEANRAKSLFLANMSHEIRTPMNGVIGMADILSKSKLDSTQKEYLDIIMKSGQTLLSLINNILDFSKIESGKMELETVPINIRSVIEEVADIHIVHATSKSIDLLTYIDPEVPEFVGGDYVRLKQIITNLVNNAIKFTSKGEVVIHVSYIGTTNGTHEIQFKIKDSGIGISKENQKKLFKSFSQVDPSTTRKYGGTGLGLAICQKLVTLMGGELDLESSSNSGSTFFFKGKFAASGEIKNNNMFLCKDQLQGKHIAIVDDNETNRLIFKNYLETWHVKVSEFKDGFEALSFFKEQYDSGNPIDLVLVDYQMPGMSGKELAKQIKADQRISDLKLILLSSIIDAIQTSEMNEIGFETGLNKPIKMNQLLNVILKVLGMPQEQKEFESVENENHLISFKNKRFLIVEDNKINIKVAQITLSGLSSHVEVATNGLEAVNLFQKHKFDVILMDIRMPVMDGVEATLKIRELEKSLNAEDPVKIIATTANTLHEDIENCMDNGMDAFLEKPFKRKDLVYILQQLL
ncbi:Signal transduction histidine-protein kinase BarA [Mariniflexile rhizosphaerae]|uniref:PAS domain-containing hybrid sensor histidine kinase/response regulator n=1 Tax=unclassified Mariniflexile TaxID=2643887 RepID=UPI000E336667|nr:PAS domain-containing hybrid sensor histidine kinase/response regulator [Mariniflexile sp. TRM1-10]AXP82076.1 Signal transduction histidine-protein kinase BarA [Mariniflexile sp. TRM1-10]